MAKTRPLFSAEAGREYTPAPGKSAGAGYPGANGVPARAATGCGRPGREPAGAAAQAPAARGTG